MNIFGTQNYCSRYPLNFYYKINVVWFGKYWVRQRDRERQGDRDSERENGEWY